jgi:hypothetical protein
MSMAQRRNYTGWIIGMFFALLLLGFVYWLVWKPHQPRAGMGAPPSELNTGMYHEQTPAGEPDPAPVR